MPIEKLYNMPTHSKGEGGYFYEPKFVNKLFQFENKLVYFTESSFQELPLELYNVIVKDTEARISSLVESVDTLNTTIFSKVEELKAELEEKIKKIAIKTASNSTKLTELENTVTTLNNIDESTINSMIDKKLESVYHSFEKLSEKFVKENVDSALKDSKREASGKLKISSLAIFKEMGYSPTEISCWVFDMINLDRRMTTF